MRNLIPSFPDVLILDTRGFLPEYRNQVQQPWLESVDFEEIVANIVSAYSYVPKCNSRLDELTELFEISTYDYKSDVSPRQAEFLISVFKQLAFDMDEYLTTRGLLEYDHFPYRVDSISGDGSIILRKTTPKNTTRV